MILFAGGENEAIDMIGGATVNTSPTTFRPDFARCSLAVSFSGGGVLQHRFAGKLAAYLAAQADDDKDFWYGYRFRGGGGFLSGMTSFTMYDDTDKPFLRLRSLSAGNLVLETSNDGFATFASYAGSAINQPGVPTEIGFRVKKHPTLGRIEWYISGALWFITPIGDTTGMMVGSPHKVLWTNANSNGNNYVSEVRASSADDPCVGWDIFTMDYLTDGDLLGWSGGVASVNEISEDVSTVVATQVADADVSFVPRAMPALGADIVVRAVVNSGKFRTADAPAPQSVDGMVRLGGVSYPANDPQVVDTVASLRQWIFEESPANPGYEFSEGEVDPSNGFQPAYRSAV